MPGRREAHAMAWTALTAGVILCAASVLLGFQGRTFMGRALGGDFVGFYAIGKILNTYPAARIYDLELAVRLQHAILPSMPATQMLVFGQAPYIAWLFRPFALLPYAWAYVAWLGFSAALYVAGLKALFGALRLTREDRKTGFLLALSWAPFLFETWIGGQMAAVVFFIWALVLCCLQSDRRFLAGLVLSLCLFKPTLVALPAAMLLIGRRWRVAGGLAVGSAMVALASLGTVGWEGCRAWAGMLAFNAQTVAGSGDAWHRAKYVDMGGGSVRTGLVERSRFSLERTLGGYAVLHLGRERLRADLRQCSSGGGGRASGGETGAAAREGSGNIRVLAVAPVHDCLVNSIFCRVLAPAIDYGGAGRLWGLDAAPGVSIHGKIRDP
jgi:hypothetical protein